jgi:hypothetical protein
MPLKTPREQKIDEFCTQGKLEPYRTLVTRILDDLQAEGVNISARYDVEFSNFEAYDDNPEHIRISLKNVKVPLNVLWILFHEFGHFRSPKIRPGDNKVAREELAWEFAEKTMAKYPELAAEHESYEACKKWCLNSYYRKYGLPEI